MFTFVKCEALRPVKHLHSKQSPGSLRYHVDLSSGFSNSVSWCSVKQNWCRYPATTGAGRNALMFVKASVPSSVWGGYDDSVGYVPKWLWYYNFDLINVLSYIFVFLLFFLFQVWAQLFISLMTLVSVSRFNMKSSNINPYCF